MNERLQKLFFAMVDFDPDPERIQHFTKVHAYAALIADGESMSGIRRREILEVAAIVHDIAIRLCLEKYGSCAGPLQEKEGPALVRRMLPQFGWDEAFIERVAWLVGHHHTYSPIDGDDHQILVEADFLVNAYEGAHSEAANRATLKNIFKTRTGSKLFQTMFHVSEE